MFEAQYLSQCDRYERGSVAGSLCEPLCTSREIQYSQCNPEGKNKVFVAQARWKKREVVLKSMKAMKLVSKLLEQYTTLTAEEFKRKVINISSSGVVSVCMYVPLTFLLAWDMSVCVCVHFSLYSSICLSVCPSIHLMEGRVHWCCCSPCVKCLVQYVLY